MKRKLVGIWAVLLALVLVSVPFGIWKAMADSEPAYQIKILEISDDGTYALKTALNAAANVTVDTMRMKTFVAMRDELDGKYDAIYFGKGSYSTALPQTFTTGPSVEQQKAHDTTSILNDITKLKAGQVESNYILKGLPVIFHTSIAKQSPTGNLYALYSKYYNSSTRPSTTLFVSDTTLGSDVVQKIKDGSAVYKQRPQVEVVAKPQDFLSGSTTIYTTGDTMTFTFNANNVKDFSTPVNAKLYASVDKALALSDENIVASSTLSSRAGTLTYKLPQTFSGPIYWKLVVTANGQSDYAQGAFRVRDKQTVIRVLQVMPNNSASSLLTATNMNQSYLSTNDYNIQITPILFSDFNTASNVNSYANLNGKYDMIIFGFVDNYNSQTSGSLTDVAAAGVNAFIKTGQAVMFTHDTMIGNTSNPWIKNFQQTTGQTGLYTNMGLGAPNKSTRTKVVNTGMLTQFPFDLSQTPSNTNGYVGQIAQTHDQYYMLDLEDPDIVPWYNIVSEGNDTYKRDSDDSYDHYYTYSKGNVTYSGTGHTNTKFPEWEQKLFVNTMFRAFIGSNHAPTITVISPTASETTKPSYLSDLVFSYQVDDLDLKDLNVYSSVKFKVNGQYVDSMAIAEKTVQKGQVITEKFKNPLPLASGTVQIEITAHDKQGASVVKTIDLTIQKVVANLQTGRTLDTVPANYEFLKGSTVGMTYTVTPQSIPAADIRSGETGLKTLEISNIVYTEKLPAGLEISGSLPTGMTKTGTLAAGYTLSKPLDKITYTLSGSSYVPNSGSTSSFHLNVVPTLKGTYSLNQARLGYEDIHGVADNASSTAAVNLMKGYSLITLGGSTTTISGGSIQGRTLFNGPATLSGFDMGTQLGSYDASFPTVSANGDVSITGGSVSNGPILTNGSFTSKQFGISNTVIMAGNDVTLNGDNGLSSSSIWAGGNLNLSNYYIGSGLNFYTVGNFNMTGGGVNGGSTTYGGTSNVTNSYITKSTAAAIKSKFDTQKNTTNAKGVSDFSAAKQQLISLSNAYAALTTNGAWTFTNDMDSVLFKGTDPTLNVFKIDATELNNLIAKRNNLRIQAPAGSTVVFNVTGGDVKFYGGYNLSGVTADRVIINYTGSGSVTINGIAVSGTILAPQSTVNFLGGDVYGTIVAGTYTTTGSTSIHLAQFAGSAPVAATTPGETRTIQFPDILFNAIVKVTSIALTPQTIWVDETTKMIPVIAPADADNQKVTWESDSPTIATVLNNGTILAGTVTGIKPGVATITAKAADGSGVVGTAKVTVESPGLLIQGGPNVNVDETISDLQVVSAGAARQLSNITWTLIGAGDAGKAKLVGGVNGQTVSLQGVEAGTVTLQVTASMASPLTGVVKPFTTTAKINVLNPLTSAAITGPTWVEVGRSIGLNTEIQPAGVHLSSIQWTVNSGSDSGKLSSTAAGSVVRTNTLTGSNTPGLVTVGAAFTTRGDSPVKLDATKAIRVVDLQIGGPEQLFIGKSSSLNAVFATYQPENWTDKPTNYAWTVTNLKKDASGNLVVDSSSGTPYATFQAGSASTAAPTINAGSEGGYVRVTLTVGGMTKTRDIQIVPYLQQLQLPSPITLYIGEKNSLKDVLNVVPGKLDMDAILPQLNWSSGNPEVATVGNATVNDKGIVTAVKEGATRITVNYPSPGPGLPAVQAWTIVQVLKKADPTTPTTPGNPDNPGGGDSGGGDTGGDRY
ncbi:DUF5057 domain-containing protein [Saccharibacillus sp. CPCC 101409]|uniref:DUF5057 domain-containing protein n=1 Tax=Saccharibacillus sp. CPCC 101409 TaxID=3058041 RepID=UPI002670DBFE|nr:DUF5057 domain-containing protein [Saccharibacillus sp. CPCC 101409]MDO3412049.1 DUF5057 domain-containing protein [Saccharibacillus sp. CPCC 101409]